MNIESISEFTVKTDRYEWRTNPLVNKLTEAKPGEKFRATFETDYLRKRAQRGIRQYLIEHGIRTKSQGWSKIAEFERLA